VKKNSQHSLVKRWRENNAHQLVHLLRILSIERTPPTTHLKEQHAQAPKVDDFAVAVIVQQNLGSEVLGRTAEGVGQGVGGQVRLGETEVAEDDVAGCVEEDVFRLEVAVRGREISQGIEKGGKEGTNR
jgi:hypothetical protein